MRLCSFHTPGGPRAGVVVPEGRVSLRALNRTAGTLWPITVDDLLASGRLGELQTWLDGHEDAVREAERLGDDVRPAPLLLHPPKILGVGLNYQAHAGDLGEERPSEPATFMKPATTIVGPGDEIVIPRASQRTTGEAELALVIGRRCRGVSAADAPSVVAGLVAVIDMTAEDILQRNPRFLTRAKSFDTFLSVGAEMVSLDEVPDITRLEVATLHGSREHRRDTVAHMRFGPWELVSFFSHVSTLEPGDMISTGTPGAAVLADGDEIGCVVTGVGEVHNPVRAEDTRA